jgi:hypothetical protein
MHCVEQREISDLVVGNRTEEQECLPRSALRLNRHHLQDPQSSDGGGHCGGVRAGEL